MDFGGSSGPIRRWAGLWENRLARAEASEGKWPDEQSLHVADWGCQASCMRSLSLTVHIYNTGFSSPGPPGLWAVREIMGMNARGIGGAHRAVLSSLASLGPEPEGDARIEVWAHKPVVP